MAFVANNITVTFSDPHFIAVIKRLAKKYSDQVEIIALPSKNGGYLCAHLPVSFLQIRFPGVQPKRTDEQIKEASARMATIVAKQKEGRASNV